MPPSASWVAQTPSACRVNGMRTGAESDHEHRGLVQITDRESRSVGKRTAERRGQNVRLIKEFLNGSDDGRSCQRKHDRQEKSSQKNGKQVYVRTKK